MARRRLFDLMQAYPFWVFDASDLSSSLFGALDPVLGFNSCTTPEWNVELKEVQPGNWEFKRRAVKTADVSPITMTRGARFYDSDFYLWLTDAIRGTNSYRRNIALVHFLPWRPAAPQGVGDTEESAVESLTTRVPGRAWMLYDCLPVRYKAGSDFDSTSSAVSIVEMTIQPEHVVEMTISTISPFAARAVSAAGSFSVANAQ
jgi:hypothetical protein